MSEWGTEVTAARSAFLRLRAVTVEEKSVIIIQMTNPDNQYPESDKNDFQIMSFANE